MPDSGYILRKALKAKLYCFHTAASVGRELYALLPLTPVDTSVCVFPAVAMRVHVRYACFCLVLSKKFNIMSALSVHQSPTLLQIIDSRAGLFWCKKGLVVNAGKMNIYFKKPPFAPIFGLFVTKCSAICR